MRLPFEEDPIRTGMSREERRARRQGEGRQIRHLEELAAVITMVGFNPYPDMMQEETNVS